MTIIKAMEWGTCPMPDGVMGYYIDLREDGRGMVRDLKPIRDWLELSLGWTKDLIDDNVYKWGVTFHDKEECLLCYLAFR